MTHFSRFFRSAAVRRGCFYLALLLIALPAAAPLWGPGMVNTRGGGDSPFLLQRTVDLAESLRAGLFPVRWMAHGAYGLGYPLFNYYAALPYYLAGALAALGLSPLLAIQATQTLGFLLAALTMGGWMERRTGNRAAALLAAAAYTYAPFHLVNVYVRGDSLSEFYAFVWYPLILWTLDRLDESCTPSRLVTAALAYGALVVTHNVSVLIFTPFALLYGLLRFWGLPAGTAQPEAPGHPNRRLRRLIGLALPFALGIGLTAWFWLPALGETRYGQMGSEFTAGYFHYSNHFRGTNLVQPSAAFDYSIATAVDQAGPFTMGAVQAALALLGVGAAAVRRRPGSGYLLGGLALSTFMITPLSQLLWDHLPLLGITQFPWRFLSVQALFTAAVTATLADFVPSRRPALPFLLAGALGGLAAGAGLLALHPDRLPITAADVTPARLAFYESFTGNIGTTIRYEYLPKDVVPRLYTSEAVIDGEAALLPIADADVALDAVPLGRSPISQRWELTLSGAAPVVFPLHAWPGWSARVDGRPADAHPAPGSGRLALDLPAGTHVVELRLDDTPLRTAAGILSLLTLLGGAGAWIAIRRRTGTPLRFSDARVRLGIPGAALVLALLLPVAFAGTPPSGPAVFFDFIQRPYPHRGPIDFGPARLLSAGPFPETNSPGSTLALPLTWQSPEPLTGTLRLISPAEPRHGVPYELGRTAVALDACPASTPCTTAVSLPLPAGLSHGLYLAELRLWGPEGERFPQSPQGTPLGTLYLGPIRISPPPPLPEDREPLAEPGELRLHALKGSQPDPTTLRLEWVGSVARRTPRNWSLSLRLMDAASRTLATQDLQPGYGYLPTSLWQPREPVTDYPILTLPEGLAPGEYRLRMIVYQEGTLETAGQADLPLTLTAATRRDPADVEVAPEQPEGLCRTAGVRLNRIALPDTLVEGEGLEFTAEWSALVTPTATLTATWELLDPVGEIAGFAAGLPAPGSDTRIWPAAAWVRAPVRIDLPPILKAAGPYTLRLKLAGDGISTVCPLPFDIPVQPRPRTFELPALPYPSEVHFGSVLTLRGYELQRRGKTLELTLWWRAETAPERDYKRFIHLFDPATEQVPVQDDAMPRAWSYPTGWWAAGEVVSETVTLDLSAVPPGRYRLAVGWYDPETVQRLPATAQGAPLPLDRAVLEPEIEPTP